MSEFSAIGECVELEIINFLNNFYSNKKKVAPILVFPPGLGIIFYKYLRYIASLYNITAIYIGKDEFKTIAILRFDHLKKYYQSNYSAFFNYAYKDSEPIDPNHIQRQLNINLSSNARKNARRYLGLPLTRRFQPSPEMQFAERMMSQLEEQGRPRHSSGALCSVRRYANPAEATTLFNYDEVSTVPLVPIDDNYDFVPTSRDYHYYPLCPLPPIHCSPIPYLEMDEPLDYIQQVEIEYAELLPSSNIEEVLHYMDVEEIGEASGGPAVFETDDISTELEALKIKNLGEPYEKEYSKYMYGSINPSTSNLSHYDQGDELENYSTINYYPNVASDDSYSNENLTSSFNSLRITEVEENPVHERIPQFSDFSHGFDDIRFVLNRPMYAFPYTFSNWNDALNLNQVYKQEIAEYVQGTPLVVLASENYDPYKELSVFAMEHIIEIYNFPASFYSNNLLNVHKEDPRYLKWCDDTHALLVMGSKDQAQRALKIKNRFVKSRPLTEGSPIAITIACQYILKPATRKNCQNYRRNRGRGGYVRKNPVELGYPVISWPSRKEIQQHIVVDVQEAGACCLEMIKHPEEQERTGMWLEKTQNNIDENKEK